ncbi:MAG TPA: YMGG-like glycine zipper-containing protein [Candidatus Methylomirabilis sp.]|nr:YMGG-like glycine zipper-containing protein [Candidatus Methylomirabilis sp.]
MRRIVLALITVFALTAIASTTEAQSFTFAPSKGQTAELQTKDTGECQAIAVQQSGYDPAKAQAAAQPQQAAGGERVRGAAKGAAVGAAAGAIGGDASKGAAAGAAAGTVGGGMKKRQDAREQTAQAQQQQTAAAQGQGAHDKAMISCMQGRGYLLK